MAPLPMLPPWVVPALLVLLGLLVGVWVARWRVRWRVARSRRLGDRGEKRARKLLRRAGYRIVDEQVTYRGRVSVDDEEVEFWVRVDAVVEREGVRYVAEFKGGAEAGSISTRATRRQLLEYAWLSEADGVVLVDTAAGRVRHVRFANLVAGEVALPAAV
jgi:hypothetical protein